MEALADRASLAASTLYRHFPTREALMRAVLAELIVPVEQAAGAADDIEDPAEAFEQVFLHSCALPTRQVEAFARIASSSPTLGGIAQDLIEQVLAPAVRRLEQAGRLRPGLTVSDVAAFVRMVETGDTVERRRTASHVLLAGIVVD